MPDFFVVGHAKCGTTALYEMLAPHPEIFMSVPKETMFLSRAPHERPTPPKGRPPSRRPQTLAAYLDLFREAPPELCAGEASTEYLRTPGTAARIAELCHEPRIIAMFREPVDFLRSLHLQLLEVGLETEGDFATALALERDRSEGRRLPRDCAWPPALQYSSHVHYVEQLREYHERFGHERMLVLIYDDFREDNEAVVRQVLRFLEVDDRRPIATTRANPTVRMRSRRLHDAAHATALGRGPVAGAAKMAVKTLLPARLRRQALSAVDRVAVDRSPTSPDESLVHELRGRFKGEVDALSEYLGRDLLGEWGYDRPR